MERMNKWCKQIQQQLRNMFNLNDDWCSFCAMFSSSSFFSRRAFFSICFVILWFRLSQPCYSIVQIQKIVWWFWARTEFTMYVDSKLMEWCVHFFSSRNGIRRAQFRLWRDERAVGRVCFEETNVDWKQHRKEFLPQRSDYDNSLCARAHKFGENTVPAVCSQ